MATGLSNLDMPDYSWDGQQRMTSLYGIIRGTEPPFFEGNPDTFTGLYFNMSTEAFEFYAPIRMNQDPCLDWCH